MTWVIVTFVLAAAIIIARIYFKLRKIQGSKQESWDAKIIEQLRSKGYAPFNVVPVNGKLFVTYAVQDEDAEDDVAGMGHGIVNTFDFDGHLLQRFAQHGQLDSPWGIALAPAGPLSGTLWIGNFGNGHINAFDPNTGELIDKVRDTRGQAIVIDGLWSLRVGNGGNGGFANTVYFTAGPNGEQDGIFGSLSSQ